MTLDREALKDWYREAMAGRIDELRNHRKGLATGDPSTCDEARAVGQALRGSGATFGFPELSELATLVEEATDASVHRRVEGLISHLHQIREGGAGVHAEWLMRASGDSKKVPAAYADLPSAWTEIGKARRLDAEELALRVAKYFGLEVADLSRPSASASRLVPEATMRAGHLLPVGEDAERILVATADPTSLTAELELSRLTGRVPHFVVATPGDIDRALAAALESAPQSVSAPRRAVRAPVDGTGRVLLVDDESSSRLLARAVLEKNGYDVVEAGDGLEALERLRVDHPVALVAADLNMPRMDGLELIWEMRAAEDWTHIPVIVVTGEDDEVLEAKLIEEGADDYIRKPLDPRLFLARVGATIRRAED